MAEYRLTGNDSIIRTADGASIPKDRGNQDRARYEAWLAAGNVPDPFVPAPISPDEVNRERDRRVASGITFNGVRYQTRDDDRENISGAGILAAIAISRGAQPGDLRWHGGDNDFVWIADDNSLVPMDAPTVIAFGQAVAASKMALIFAARAIKDRAPIPADYASKAYWPAAQ